MSTSTPKASKPYIPKSFTMPTSYKQDISQLRACIQCKRIQSKQMWEEHNVCFGCDTVVSDRDVKELTTQYFEGMVGILDNRRTSFVHRAYAAVLADHELEAGRKVRPGVYAMALIEDDEEEAIM
eukprot:gnl/Dysnectes_brevis/1246_a1391_3708.p1 GENE.gnl/Dysnectes_brevis/1246_a1391_3708~~gnl/Dysnectes_brevis/1246_a1391_3708.p1  ORF type:complete len:125 (+),score=3.16 gnl/Dysnectes_brevis/1246_a1391_3708:78-452(+)